MDSNQTYRPRHRFAVAFSGIAAALAGFLITYALRLTLGSISLPEVSAQLAIEFAPGSVSRYIIEHLGKGGKVGGTIFAFLVYFAAAALLALLFDRLRPRLPASTPLQRGLVFSTIPLAITAIFMGLVILARPAIVAGAPLVASLASLVLLNLTFGAIVGLLVDANPVAEAVQRREFLFAGGVALGAAAFTLGVTRSLFQELLDAVGAPAGRMPTFITSNSDFYQVAIDVVSPKVNASTWKLSVGGNVEQPFQLTYDELSALPMIEKVITLECVSNEVGGPLISNALWRGVPLSALLQRAGLRPNSREIVLQAADGYSDSIPIDMALAADTMLAVYMNGKRLPADHGFPTRLLVPGLFGMENVKWILSIQVVTGAYHGYWQSRGWVKFATVRTMSKISLPLSGATMPAGMPVDLGGVAFAGNRGIQKVELSIRPAAQELAETWIPAQLLAEGSQITWTRWQYQWMPPGPGPYTVEVRAVDATGAPQIEQPAPIFPAGSTGYHNIRLRVV